MLAFRRFCLALLLGACVVGPLVSYVSFVAKFGIGLTSSFALTKYVMLTLGLGTANGIVAALACWVVSGRPARASAATAVVAIACGASVALAVWSRPSTPPSLWITLLGTCIVDTLQAAATGYFTAVAAAWGERRLGGAPVAP